jgi:hypothetical protein
MKSKWLILLFLVILSFSYRFYVNNNLFWVDEFSTAEQAKLVIENGADIFTQNNYYFEPHNITTHFLVAGSFLLFGIGELQAKIPFMIIGSLVAVLIYFFSKKLFNKNIALISSLLYIFSYWQITWARQARGYVLQQLLIILSIYLYHQFSKKFSIKNLFLLSITAILGILTHTTYFLIIATLFTHFIIFNRQKFLKLLFQPINLILIPLVLFIIKITGQFTAIWNNLKSLITYHPNNLAYYHSFLWREQTIITLLAFLGILILWFKKRKYNLSLLLLLPIGAYLFFVCFLFAPYVSRYLLPIFPLFFILAGLSISELATHISKKHSLIFALIITLFIIVNGDKFVLKPKTYYSVNHDMREIALIDYDQVYNLIKNKGELEKGQTAVIDTWPDRTKWYLGKNHEYLYAFRWINSPGLVNGIAKKTNYKVNKDGEKYIASTGKIPFKLIGELSDLKKAMTKYHQGFIFIDDASLPEDVIEYAQSNFKKELYLDHYPLDDNPYSIWPATLYSWGFED